MSGRSDVSSTGESRSANPADEADRGEVKGIAPATPSYRRPRLFHLGTVVDATRGSSSSGNSDANSQFYW